MDFGALARRARKETVDNAPTILTVIGVTGVVTTAVLTGKATLKAKTVLDLKHHELVDNEFEPLPPIEQFKIVFPDVWKLYVPAVGTGVMTVTCILAANHINSKRAAALASAYSVSQELFGEYRKKLIDKIGEKKEQEVRDAAAQDAVNQAPIREVFITETTETYGLDRFSGRYFKTTMQELKAAQNDINFRILSDDYASLTDYYDRIGLTPTSESDDIGWNTDCKLDVDYSAAICLVGEVEKPVITISFRTIPIRGFWSFHK